MDSIGPTGPKVKYRILDRGDGQGGSIKLSGIQLDVSRLSNCAQSIRHDDDDDDDDEMSTPTDRMSIEQKLAMRQALNNPLLLHTIIGSLNRVSDLKTCRLVATNWRTVSSEILSKNDLCKIKIYYFEISVENGRRWIFGSATTRAMAFTHSFQSLSDLTNLMTKASSGPNSSSSFCCSHFHFENGNLEEEAAQEFFKLHGPKIKTLGLESIDEDTYYSDDDNDDYPDSNEIGESEDSDTDRSREAIKKLKKHQTWTSSSTFVNILNRRCPKLEILHLKYLSNQWSEGEDNSDDDLDLPMLPVLFNNNVLKMRALNLPTLKEFNWCNVSREVVKGILEGSPNLEIISSLFSMSEKELSMIVETKKASKLKNLQLLRPYCTPTDFIQVINGNGGSRLQLQKMSLWRPNVDDRRVIQLALEMMNRTKSSLEFLEVSLFELVSNTDFAQEYAELWQQLKFDKVTTLKLQTARCCLPLRGVKSLSEMFPNLKCLDLMAGSPTDVLDDNDADGEMSVTWPQLRSSSIMLDALSHVSTLRLPDSCVDVAWLLLLHKLCPKFEHLVIEGKKNLHELLPHIFQIWTHLKSLKLIFLKSDPYYSYSYSAKLDSAITGLSEDNCQKLLNFPGHDQYVESECQYVVDQLHSGNENDVTNPTSDPSLQEFKMLVNVSVKVQKPKADRPSIVDMKKLETMDIVFERLKFFGEDTLPLSCLSWMYGFNLLPDVKVVVQYDLDYCSAKELETVNKNLAPYCPNLRYQKFLHNAYGI